MNEMDMWTRGIELYKQDPKADFKSILINEGYKEANRYKDTSSLSRGIRAKLTKPTNYTRILSLSDQHYPFIIPNYYDVIKPFANKVEVLIFNGDEEDCQAISHFRKKYRKPFVPEMIGTREMICKTIDLIKPKQTLFVRGNHNSRFINYMSDKVHDDILELMPNSNLDLIINDGFYRYNKEENTKTYYEPLVNKYGDKVNYNGSWYVIVGKTIFAHPQAYKKAHLATPEAVMRYFQDQRVDFDCVVMPHTHKIGFAPQGNVMLYEQGCLCQPMEYAEARLHSPQQNGFMYVVQDEKGNHIYEKSQLIWIR